MTTSLETLQQMTLKALQSKAETEAKKAEEASAAMEHWVQKVTMMVDLEIRKAAKMGKFSTEIDIRTDIVYRVMANFKHLNPKELGPVNFSTKVRFTWSVASESSGQTGSLAVEK